MKKLLAGMISGCAFTSGAPSPVSFLGYSCFVVLVISLINFGVVLYCEIQRFRSLLMFALAVLAVAAVVLLSSGCARDAQLLKIDIPEKNSPAEEAGLWIHHAAGAWDCLFTPGSE